MECLTLRWYDENRNPVFRPKKKFPTLDDAIKVAKQVNTYDNTIHKVVAYKCTKCHNYHIGRNGRILTEKERERFKKQLSI